jgi:hypothetical protein
MNMIGATINQRGTTLIQRLVLEPGMATPWHVDPYHRIAVVIRGEALAIEYRDGREVTQLEVVPGLTEWDAPVELVHRAANVGSGTYEQVTIYFLDRADAVAQPLVE